MSVSSTLRNTLYAFRTRLSAKSNQTENQEQSHQSAPSESIQAYQNNHKTQAARTYKHVPAPWHDVKRPSGVLSLDQVWIDVMMDVDHIPQAGDYVETERMCPTIDGAYRSLQAASRMGVPTAHAGMIGTGPWATLIRNAFEIEHITHIGSNITDADNGMRLVLRDSNNKQTFVASYGAESQCELVGYQNLNIRTGDVVLISGTSIMERAACGILEFLDSIDADPSQRNFQLVLSPTNALHLVNDELLEKLVLARPLWTCNRQAALSLANRLGIAMEEIPVTVGGSFDAAMQTLCRQLGETLRAPLVLRAGSRGAWVREPGGQVSRVGAFETKAIHTRSAGTTHTGTLCAYLAQGYDLLEATRAANATASLAIEHSLNGVPQCPTHEEVKALLSSVQSNDK